MSGANTIQADTTRSIARSVWEKNKDKLNSSNNVFWFDKIPTTKLTNARQKHGLDIHTDIWFLHDRTFFGSADNSLVMGDHGISHHYDGDRSHNSWQTLHEAALKEGSLILYRDDKHERYDQLDVGIFGPSYVEGFPEAILKVIRQVIKATDNPFERIRDQILDAMDQEAWAKALSYIPEFAEHASPCFAYGLQGSCLNELERYEEAERVLALALENAATLDVDSTWLKTLHEELGVAQANQGKLHEAYYHVRRAREVAPAIGDELVIERELLDAVSTEFNQALPTIPFDDRKLVFVGDHLPQTFPTGFMCLDRRVSGSLTFPVGHPQADSLYIAHPYVPGTYMELSTYQTQLFQDKLMELSHLLQSLGATELEITCDVGGLDEEQRHVAASLAAGAQDALGRGAAGQFFDASAQSASNASHKNMMIVQRFVPTHSPFVPDGLTWYPNELGWQRLVQQRLQGGIVDYQMSLSTSDVVLLSGARETEVRAEFDALVLNAGGSSTTATSTNTRSVQSTKWIVRVQFAPLESTSVAEVFGVSGAMSIEEEYRDFVRECLLEDGELDTARRLLNRWARRLGIDADTALRLEDEQTAAVALTSVEKTYFDEVMFCLEDDGRIDEQERRFLDRHALRLSLDPDRVEYIERIAHRSNKQ